MSIAAMNWAFCAEVEPSGAKFVLVALADHADADGHCYPGQDLLAAKTGQSVRSVRKHLAQLSGGGWISRSKRRRAGRQTSDAFDLNVDPEARAAAAKAAGGGRPDGDAQAAESAAGAPGVQAADPVGPGGRSAPVQAAESAAEPSRNQKEPGAREGRPCGAAPHARAEAGEEDAAAEAGPPPANAAWRAAQPEIEASIAAPLARLCVPDSDDGETMVLAVMCPGVGYAVLAWAVPTLEAIMERTIFVVTRSWVAAALVERGVRYGRGMLGAKVAERVVSLADRAWTEWRCIVADPRLAGFEPALGQLLPDGIRDGVLRVKGESAVAMVELGFALDGMLNDVAAPLSVKLGLGTWVGPALAVREAWAAALDAERERSGRTSG